MAKLKAKELRKLQRDQTIGDADYIEEPLGLKKQEERKEAIKRTRIRKEKYEIEHD